MSNKGDDKWLKDLRKRMEDYSEPLPEGLWEELEGDLNRPKVIPFWRRWPAVAAAVALVLVVSSLMLSKWFAPMFEGEVMQVAQQKVQLEAEKLVAGELKTHQAQSEESTAEEFVTEESATKVLATKQVALQSSSKGLAANQTEEKTSPALIAEAEVSVPAEVLAEAEVSAPTEAATVSAVENPAAENPAVENPAADDASVATVRAYPQYRTSTRSGAGSSSRAGYQASYKKNHRSGQIELGIHTGGAPYGASKEFDGMGRLATERLNDSKAPVLLGNVNSKLTPYNQVLFSNRDQHTYTEVNHHMPINVVASVKWNFAENWAFESGISYTFLESDLHSGARLYWEDTQKLHYVGIPMKIHRNIWNNHTVGFYASAGGMLEKCVSGSIESVYVTNQNEQEREKHDVGTHPFQGSLSAAVGAQVNFLKSLSLFVEPGVAYFFDDNSRLVTIRKEHPFNFNLQFGLRLNLNR